MQFEVTSPGAPGERLEGFEQAAREPLVGRLAVSRILHFVGRLIVETPGIFLGGNRTTVKKHRVWFGKLGLGSDAHGNPSLFLQAVRLPV